MSRVRTKGGNVVADLLGNRISDTYGQRVISPVTHSCVHSSEVCSDEIHKNYPYEGGPFGLQRVQTSFSDGDGWFGTQRKLTSYRMDNYYIGSMRCSHASAALPSPDTGCADFGAAAWDKFKPAQPDVSLAQFFGELGGLKDMIPKKLKTFRDLGSNYLAIEFGWKPFLSDIRNWYQSLIEIDKRVSQLRRDNGRWIRRGGIVKHDSDSGQLSINASNQITPWDPNAKSYYAKRTFTYEERVWFSAAFRYYIPGLDSQEWGKLRAIQELWDLKITPEAVYNLIPFSWLVDWHSNLGSVISNLQASINDHLVAKYAYVMRHKKTTTETHAGASVMQRIQATPTSPYETKWIPVSCSSSVTVETKARAVANPFGFNVFLPDYSAWQKSILLALGLGFSRVRS